MHIVHCAVPTRMYTYITLSIGGYILHCTGLYSEYCTCIPRSMYGEGCIVQGSVHVEVLVHYPLHRRGIISSVSGRGPGGRTLHCTLYSNVRICTDCTLHCTLYSVCRQVNCTCIQTAFSQK